MTGARSRRRQDRGQTVTWFGDTWARGGAITWSYCVVSTEASFGGGSNQHNGLPPQSGTKTPPLVLPLAAPTPIVATEFLFGSLEAHK